MNFLTASTDHFTERVGGGGYIHQVFSHSSKEFLDFMCFNGLLLKIFDSDFFKMTLEVKISLTVVENRLQECSGKLSFIQSRLV